MMKVPAPTRVMGDHHYALIGSAVAGRTITVRWHDTARLDCHANVDEICLPVSRAHEDLTIPVIAQALMLRASSFRTKILRTLKRNPSAARWYVNAEVTRAARQYACLLPRRFLESVARSVPSNQPVSLSLSAEASLSLALAQRVAKPPSGDFGSLPPTGWISLLTRKDQPLRGIPGQALEDSAESAKRQFEEGERVEPDVLRLFNLMSIPVSERLSRFLARLIGTRLERDQGDVDADGKGTPLETATGSLSGKAEFVLRQGRRAVSKDQVVRAEPGIFSYPEWDSASASYRRNWVSVEEVDPWREDGGESELAARLPPPSGFFRRQFAGIGLGFENHRGQSEGHELDIDRVVEWTIDVRAGTSPRPTLYQSALKTRRDLGVAVLLDVSGSTGEKGVDGRTVHEKQVLLAWQIASTLCELGDHVSIHAFHSWGRERVRLLRLKDFDESGMSMAVRARFASLEPSGFTRIGAALRHASSQLITGTGLPNRLVICITDGFSFDFGYEGAYGEGDAAKAIEEIRALGTGCICLTIASAQEANVLERVFGAAATLSVADEAQFVVHVRRVLQMALRQIGAARGGASLARRTARASRA